MRKCILALVILLPIVFLTGLALGNLIGAYQANEQMGKLKAELDQKEIYINHLQRWLEGNVSSYEAEISSLQGVISDLKEKIRVEILGIYFSPKGGCENVIISWIRSANRSIHVLIYSFTLDLIAEELIYAYKRGVDVKVLFEKSQISLYSEYMRLKEAGVPVRNDTNPDFMHNKVMIIDGEIVFTGSYNWSKSAEEDNDENLIIIKSMEIAETYEEKFEEIWNKGV